VEKYPIKKDENQLTNTKKDVLEISEPSFFQNPFFSFKYSCKSISSFAGKSHIKIKEQRFENGKFETEEFEGTTDGNIYNNMISEMQNYYSNQISILMKSWSSFFSPLSTKDND
jgi:hypothetical protein